MFTKPTSVTFSHKRVTTGPMFSLFPAGPVVINQDEAKIAGGRFDLLT